MQRNALVRYTVREHEVEAIVRTIHRDGSVTVEPRFFVRDGKRTPGYIGGKVRLEAADCRPNA